MVGEIELVNSIFTTIVYFYEKYIMLLSPGAAYSSKFSPSIEIGYGDSRGKSFTGF
jgi:hypothetical protein